MVLPQPLITFSSRHLPRQSNPFKYICIYVNIYIYIYIFIYIHIYIHIYIYIYIYIHIYIYGAAIHIYTYIYGAAPAVAHGFLEAPATPELNISSDSSSLPSLL